MYTYTKKYYKGKLKITNIQYQNHQIDFKSWILDKPDTEITLYIIFLYVDNYFVTADMKVYVISCLNAKIKKKNWGSSIVHLNQT